MTKCSVHTITTHANHHHHHHRNDDHHHPSLRFMGSGTDSHSGSGSGSNSPPPIKTEPKNEDDLSLSTSTPSRTPPTLHSPPVGLLNHRNLVQDEKLVVATLASLNSGDPSNIIKQDLRLIIQSRRKAEGKGELQVDFKTPPKDELTEEEWERVRKRRDQNRLAAQRFRQKQRKISSTLSDQQLTTEEVEKRARRRELNRLAAKRSREKGQRRKETLIQEIQGLQARNGALEGVLGSLVEERDSLVQTLKDHLPQCQNSAAMTRSAQLLAFSHDLSQLLDWAIPGPGPTGDPPDHSQAGDVQVAPPPPQPPPPPAQLQAHQSHHQSQPSPSTPLPPGIGSGDFSSAPQSSLPPAVDLPSPSSAPLRCYPRGQGVSKTAGTSGRELEIDASAAAVLKEEIERRQHRHPYRVSAPASPTLPSHYSAFSPRASPPPTHPASQPLTPTQHFPSPSHSLSSHLPSPSHSLPPHLPSPSCSLASHLPSPSHSLPPHFPSQSLPPHLPSPSHSLPPHLPSPSHSLPPHLPSPSHSLPPHLLSPSQSLLPHLPSPSQSLPPHLPSPSLPPHLPSPSHSLPPPLPSPSLSLPPHLPSPSHSLPPHLPSPSHSLPPPLPSPSHSLPSHLPSPSHSLPPHLPSPAHSLPPYLPSPSQSHLPSPTHSLPLHISSPSSSLPPHLPSPSLPFPSHLSSPSQPRPSQLGLDMGSSTTPGRDSVGHLVSYTGTSAEESLKASSSVSHKNPKTGLTTGVKRPQSLDLRGAGIIPKKDPALRSPVIPKKDPALRSPLIPKKDPALRSPTIPKKDPALRSPVIETSPMGPVSATATTSSALRSSSSSSSSMFKRGPVQRVASFHGVSAQSPGEQMAPLNLSKRRKSEDYSSMMEEDQNAVQGDLSGLHTWPPPGTGWMKRDEPDKPLNLVCREQPCATVTSGQVCSLSQEDMGCYALSLAKQGQHSATQEADDSIFSSAAPRQLMRFSSFDGSS